MSRLDEYSQRVWVGMLDAEFNRDYWKALTYRFVKKERWQRAIQIFCSSSTVAGWSFFIEYPIIWKAMSVLSVLTSISAATVFNYKSQIKTCSDLHGKWCSEFATCESYWLEIKNLNSNDKKLRARKILKNKAELVKLEAKELDDRKLAKKCQDMVLERRELA